MNDHYDVVLGEDSSDYGVVLVKEEVFDGDGSPASAVDFLTPVEGLNEPGPPPFVRKTFDMVEDPETDPIVSWNVTRESFVVWDSHEFCKTLLPKYFKHQNFSSFVRQLNTYGFRKIDSDRWEFAHEAFKGGKKHLLNNIRRRSKYNTKAVHQGAFNSMKPGLEDEVKKLKRDTNILKQEILKVRKQHENTQIQLTNTEERVRSAELKQCQMLSFLTRIAKMPSCVEQLIQKVKRKRELDGVDTVKRPRLLGTMSPERNPNNVDSQELDALLQSELTGLSVKDELCSSIQCLKGNDVSSSAYDVMSEELMGESSVGGEEVNVNDSNIYLELEDLITRPLDWVGSSCGGDN